jgi:hypothetical protein
MKIMQSINDIDQDSDNLTAPKKICRIIDLVYDKEIWRRIKRINKCKEIFRDVKLSNNKRMTPKIYSLKRHYIT